VSVSAYYQRRRGHRSARAGEDERLLGRIRELHAANYDAYGYRRMWKALQRAGEQVPRCRGQRLMRAAGLVGAKRRGKPWRTTGPDPQAARRPDLLPALLGGPRLLRLRARRLQADDRRLATGQPRARRPRPRRAADGASSPRPRRRRRADHHSDRGSQSTSIDYTQTLTDHRVLASVGSVGDAYDNALAESFVDSFKTELIADRVWRSRTQLELAVVEYIGWYKLTVCTNRAATSRRSNTSRSIIGWVGFHITSQTANGSSGTLNGYFTRYIAQGLPAGASGPNGGAFGVHVVTLVE
jgi:putative transposase